MKNLIKYLISFLIFLLVLPAISMAQDVGVDTGLSFDPTTWFATLGTFVAAVIAATQVIKKSFKIEGAWAMIASWLISVALAAVGWLLQLGIFAGLQWYWGLVYALSAGLIANKVFELFTIEAIISFLKSIFKKPA